MVHRDSESYSTKLASAYDPFVGSIFSSAH